jgi:GNAT superfamily N-acetyltransferase
MNARFAPVTFAEIEAAVRHHLAALPAAIDSYVEDHILASAHYRIVIAGEPAGFASIHEGSLITQFALAEPFRRHGRPLFAQLRRLEQVQAAYVPTCDEFFLAHALDDERQLARQAYLFAAARDTPPAVADGSSLQPAAPEHAEFIRQHSGDFCEPVERRLAGGELFLTRRRDESVGFGLLLRSALYADVASIGMFTLERYRRSGVGTATISLLIAECRRRGLRPVAGCWYYNHVSKRTLERAGMFSPSRLLKVDY